jgi:hypothetical protein
VPGVKYLVSIFLNPANMAALTEAERDGITDGVGRFVDHLKSTGELVGSYALGAPEESAVVRVRGGVPAVTDGPFLESKEFLAGYYVVDVESRARALEIAGLVPDATLNAMEVRPIVHDAMDG